MNTKGSILDQGFIALMILIFLIGSLIGLKILDMFNSKIQATDNAPTEAKETVSKMNTRFPLLLNGVILMIFIGSQLVTLWLAFRIPSDPGMVPLSIIGLIIITFISFVLSVVYKYFSLAPELATQAAQLTLGNSIMLNMHILTFVFGAVVITLMVMRR